MDGTLTALDADMRANVAAIATKAQKRASAVSSFQSAQHTPTGTALKVSSRKYTGNSMDIGSNRMMSIGFAQKIELLMLPNAYGSFF